MTTQDIPRSAWRSWRETIPGLSMSEVARRAGMNSGRLSIIERGVPATADEAVKLRRILMDATEALGREAAVTAE